MITYAIIITIGNILFWWLGFLQGKKHVYKQLTNQFLYYINEKSDVATRDRIVTELEDLGYIRYNYELEIWEKIK